MSRFETRLDQTTDLCGLDQQLRWSRLLFVGLLGCYLLFVLKIRKWKIWKIPSTGLEKPDV